MRETPRYCENKVSAIDQFPASVPLKKPLTGSEVPQIGELIAPLCYDSDCIFKKCDNNQEAADSRQVSV